MGELLSGAIAHDEAGCRFFDGPGRREVAGGISHYCLLLAAAGGAGRTSPHGSGFFFSGTETPLIVDWYARSTSLSFFFSWSARKELVFPGNPRFIRLSGSGSYRQNYDQRRVDGYAQHDGTTLVWQ